MGWSNPPIPWSEFERNLSDLSRPGSAPPVGADGGDSPAWSYKRKGYVPPADLALAGPAVVPYAELPQIDRADYVFNANDSYWLANATAPLTGFPPIFGPAGTVEQSLRTRLGHTMALERLAGTDGYAGKKATSEIVRQMVLNSRVFSAERFKIQALDMVCTTPQIAVTGAGNVDVTAACAALRAWDNAGNVASRGSHVWDEFWSRVTVPATQLYAVAFDAADPLK